MQALQCRAVRDRVRYTLAAGTAHEPRAVRVQAMASNVQMATVPMETAAAESTETEGAAAGSDEVRLPLPLHLPATDAVLIPAGISRPAARSEPSPT